MLDITAAYPLIVFELPARCTKCIAYRNIRVVVSMTSVMLMLHIELSSAGLYLDVDFMDTALMSMFVRQFDDHLTVNHLAAELLEALRQLPYARFKSGRRFDTAPGDLNWDRHDFVLSMLNRQRPNTTMATIPQCGIEDNTGFPRSIAPANTLDDLTRITFTQCDPCPTRVVSESAYWPNVRLAAAWLPTMSHGFE
jgi:hypothetical protein